ncbi:hypothetical protein TYRP_007930 [Tyrophagus putrescentiae]|nr:hypothetical protein TYRP_007930 [Tyrophagus putrescentiae]
MKALCLLFACCLIVPSLILCTDDAANKSPSTAALTKRLGDENIFLSLARSVAEFASNGFRTGLEASVRSIFNKPVTTAVYALSMLVGVVAMLAFYESPISPMPVPPLPDPPVGRFPPEHPIWPPKNQPGGQMQYNGQKRAGVAAPHSFVLPNIPVGMMNPNFYQQYQSAVDNHRSDKSPVYPAARNKQHSISAHGPSHHVNETSYNNYISKLTSALDLNNNPLALEQLKHIYRGGSDMSNKVIDYNNKRIAVESLKFNSNSTQQSPS